VRVKKRSGERDFISSDRIAGLPGESSLGGRGSNLNETIEGGRSTIKVTIQTATFLQGKGEKCARRTGKYCGRRGMKLGDTMRERKCKREEWDRDAAN